ncbi:hypothetical protein [Aquifex sp.]
MNRRDLLKLTPLILLPAVALSKEKEEDNKFIDPATVDTRLDAAYAVSKLLSRHFDNVGVVFMENSQLCAVFAAALTNGLRLLGKTAWYIEGGKKFIHYLEKYKPEVLYMAYFGELPEDEVQESLNSDLKQLAEYGKPFSLVFHISTVQKGFVNNAVFEEGIPEYFQKVKNLYAVRVIENKVVLAKASEISDFGVSFGKIVDQTEFIKFQEG